MNLSPIWGLFLFSRSSTSSPFTLLGFSSHNLILFSNFILFYLYFLYFLHTHTHIHIHTHTYIQHIYTYMHTHTTTEPHTHTHTYVKTLFLFLSFYFFLSILIFSPLWQWICACAQRAEFMAIPPPLPSLPPTPVSADVRWGSQKYRFN